MRIVVALGGNALLRRGEAPEAATQRRRLAPVAREVAALATQHEVLVVHGNGPQVGLLAMESGADPALSQPFPLGDLVAESQGLIGSWIQQALLNESCDAVAMITQVVVDGDDPAFDDPRKPIGRVHDETTARALVRDRGWSVREEDEGWRRVVASPRPTDVLQLTAAGHLVDAGFVVVLGGGGGVPNVPNVPEGREGSEGRTYAPVDAVVDKDLVAGIVADRLGADALVVLTDVEGVLTDFGTPRQAVVPRVTAADLLAMELPAGSMQPKAEACAGFVTGGVGRRAVIGPLERLADAVVGQAGTQVVA